jgi:hypothetical protein
LAAVNQAITAEESVTITQPARSAHLSNRPRRARPAIRKTIPTTAHLPKCAHSAVVPQPTSTQKGRVWVNVRCPLLRRGSRLSLVAV